MFSTIRVDHYKEKTCVEELSNKDSICNGCKSLTVGVFTDPCNEFDGDYLKDLVEANDYSSDGKA